MAAAPALAQVDPAIVGTWKLQWIGPDVYWQIRADGHYRSFGTGARPNEHWGRMTAAGRRDVLVAAHVLKAHGTMAEAIARVEEKRAGRAHGGAADAGQWDGEVVGGADDPISDPVNDPVNPMPSEGLGVRQRWFIEALASGHEVGAAALHRRWDVSVKTAKRDLADLRARGLIEFVGPPRTGRYRLRR